MNWNPENADPAVGSYMPALRWVLERTTGAILELGGGYFSSPLVHEEFHSGRAAITYEYDAEWAHELGLRFDQPITQHFDQLAEMDWDIVLIDCEGWNRLPFFVALKPRADTFIIHDSQDPWIPEEAMRGFRYRYDFDDNPRTTMLSRTIDVAKFGG